jgi:Ni,Fe-hydrogenase maturation factor
MRSSETNRAATAPDRVASMARVALPSVRLLVCGTTDRGDEGAALVAVATLLPALSVDILRSLEVRRCPNLGIDDLAGIPPGVAAIMIDVAMGLEPGTVAVLPLKVLADSGALVRPMSSRSQPVHRLIASASDVRGSLPDGSFVAIGGARFNFGGHLSRPVRMALPAIRAAIEGEIRLRAGLPVSPGRTDPPDGPRVPPRLAGPASTLVA